MDAPEFIFPPNKPLDRMPAPSKVPMMYDYLFFVDTNEEGEFLLGCSNINGQLWEGTLFYYKDCPAALMQDQTGYYISPSTTSDAKFMQTKNNNYIVLAEDSGIVKLLSTNSTDNGAIPIKGLFYTNAPVSQLAVWKNNSKLLLAADRTVALWNIGQHSKPLYEYKNYHTDKVASVDTNKANINLFASASHDRKVCIWDDRIAMPAKILYKNEFAALTSVAWSQLHLDNLLVGSEGGDLYLLDIRQPDQFKEHQHCFNASVHRIACNSKGKVAVCGDLSDVLVFSEDVMDKEYMSTVHSNFVRGLAWSNDFLFSCGFDKKIAKHTI